ncbi:S8 family serine peptidase [Methanolobus mangrovi]|uniref:S8 family serine peptidase n=1 Tax=Methanolobus mangrovi TaxID=3072977 RepID=A0AA51YJP9_9EURY|nr:S8 family serine peptidase [Methanolobus mangrovi]WMW22865.1 S8 family serine peptidase [Methanolobus mangrovi]
MNRLPITLLMIVSILLSFVVAPASAVPNDDEKVPVLIKFKGKTDAQLVKANGGSIKYEYDVVPAIAAELPQKAIDALYKNPNIELIEPDRIAQITEETIPWGITRVNAPATQALGFTGSGIKVAVIDTGVDYNHPDLAANYLGGYDYVNDDNYPMDDHSHGTHVAGTVLGIDNEIGVLGVAPNAGFYALKAADSTGYATYSDIIASINWAVNNGADVITMSLGGSPSSTLEAACDNAYNSGVVVVAAAGNSGGAVIYPAGYDSVIAVSATDSNNVKASWSSYGPEVELAAPGVSIYSTMPGSSYGYKSGTSMATPHVTGVVALLLSTDVSGTNLDLDKDGTWDPAEVRARLQSTATDIGASGQDDYYGYGLVNALAAVSDLEQAPAVEDPVETVTPPADEAPAGDSPVEEMHLSDLSVTTDYSVKANKHVFAYAIATATVVDVDGNPLSGATVTGDWSGLVSGTVSAVTDSSGVVTFQSAQLKNPLGSFIFTVTGVTLDGYTYNSGANGFESEVSADFTLSLK